MEFNRKKVASLIRRATLADLSNQRDIIIEGKEMLQKLGIDMWTDDYPSNEELLDDIINESSYVYCEDGKIVATFALYFGIDPIYEKLENGSWLSQLPYSLLKRIAVSSHMRGKNIIGKIIDTVGFISAAKGFPSLRLDTHPDNKSMKRAIEKNGYLFTGELNTDQTWHAYEKIVNQSDCYLKKAAIEDIPEIMAIINDAKVNLKNIGIDQWQDGYPNEAGIEADIKGGNSYLYYENNQLVAVLALFFGEDPLYQHIENGEWLTDRPYSAIHRVAVANDMLGQGVMGRVFDISETLTRLHGFGSMRIDTHEGNTSMRRAIEKAGYTYCGHVFLENGDLRLAYEKSIDTKC